MDDRMEWDGMGLVADRQTDRQTDKGVSKVPKRKSFEMGVQYQYNVQQDIRSDF